jgi:hypothetical protein
MAELKRKEGELTAAELASFGVALLVSFLAGGTRPARNLNKEEPR